MAYINAVTVTIPTSLQPFVAYCEPESWDDCVPQYIGGIRSIALIGGDTDLTKVFANDVVIDDLPSETIQEWIVWPIARESGQLVQTENVSNKGTWFDVEISGNAPDHYWRKLLSLWRSKRIRYYVLLADNMGQYLLFDEPSFRVLYTDDTGSTRSSNAVTSIKISGRTKQPFKYLTADAVAGLSFKVNAGCSLYLTNPDTITAADLLNCFTLQTSF